MTDCPCRRCARSRSSFPLFFDYFTDEERLAVLKKRFVTHVAKWGETWLDAAWLENELDELFGLKHSRWQAEQERKREREREARRARVDALRDRILGRYP